jgi:replicative DNA helicase
MIADPIAEQRVIGAVIHSAGRVLDELQLTEDDFSDPNHARLWKAVNAYRQTGKPLTDDLFAGYLRQHNAMELLPALGECLSGVVVPQQAAHFADLVRLARKRRSIAAAGAAFQQLAATPGDFELDELFAQASAQFDRFIRPEETTGGLVTLADSVSHALDQRWGKPDTSYLPTGWRELDERLNGGLRPGHLVIVGARPSVGKSFVGTGLARYAASRGNPVLFHSLEMGAHELTDRVIAPLAPVTLSTLNAGAASPEELDRLGDRIARDEVFSWPLYIDDRSNITLAGISGRARDLKRKGQLSLIIVDYLQLITPADRKVPREQQVASFSRGLKLLAKELDVPIVALAQVNRGANDKERPRMHHLRESGSIEADADEILLLHVSDEPDMYGQLEIIVEKNRHGSKGSLQLQFLPTAGLLADA